MWALTEEERELAWKVACYLAEKSDKKYKKNTFKLSEFSTDEIRAELDRRNASDQNPVIRQCWWMRR